MEQNLKTFNFAELRRTLQKEYNKNTKTDLGNIIREWTSEALGCIKISKTKSFVYIYVGFPQTTEALMMLTIRAKREAL